MHDWFQLGNCRNCFYCTLLDAIDNDVVDEDVDEGQTAIYEEKQAAEEGKDDDASVLDES